MTNKKIADQIIRCLVGACDDTCPYYSFEENVCDSYYAFMPIVEEFLKKAEDMMDKEEQGLLIELPLRVGDTFWEMSWTEDAVYPSVAQSLAYCCYVKERLGKWCFLTQAEAEEALAKMGEQHA